jgi:RNA polymerase sigma-B factor
MNAINHFDPRFGTSLAAYARPCISGEIKRHFRDKRWQLRVRRTAQEIRAEVLKAEAELIQRLSRLPTDQDIADYLQVRLEDVEEGRSAEQAFRALSLDAPLAGDSEAGTLADLLGDEDSGLGTSLDMESVWTHISELPGREQEIVALRFYGNMTQAQIGEKLGISQMHVSRLLSHALTVLRSRLLSDDPGAGAAR